MRDYFSKNERVNVTDLGFKIAWGVMDYQKGTPLDNPEYVKWTVRLNKYINQKSNETWNLKFHKCT